MRARKEWLNWFRVDRDVADHPKLSLLASRLGIHPERALGRLIRLWAWVARFAPDGILEEMEAAALRQVLGDAAGGIGGSLAPDPLAPFIEAGFLDIELDGQISAHDWYEMNGTQLRERQRDRRRIEERTSIPAGLPREYPGNLAGTVRNGTVRNGEESEDLARSRGGSKPAEIICEIPTISGRPFPIWSCDLEMWSIAYPAVNVQAELLRAKAWSHSNPRLRKTAGGMKRFLNTWLAKCQDQARPASLGAGPRSSADARYAAANPQAREESHGQ